MDKDKDIELEHKQKYCDMETDKNMDITRWVSATLS